MFSPLPTPAEMSAWDRAAVAFGVPECVLMENAAREALHVLVQECGSLVDKTVLLFMGAGNNGGDAVCLARHLLDAGARPTVLHTRPLSACRGTAGRHMRLAKRCGVRLVPLPAGDAPSLPGHDFPDIVVDGLLGTGFSGTLRPREQHVIERINILGERSFVLALDVPSGLCGLTGRALPVAVRAQATVTFEAAKPGLVLPEAASRTGRLHVRPIGIPRSVRESLPPSFQKLEPSAAVHLPCPAPCWHKGSAGRVLVIGGSDGPDGGLVGAPHLAALAALRSGAGLVSVAAPAGLCAAIKAACPDIMTRSLGSPEVCRWSPDLKEQTLRQLRECDAAVIGPGMGRQPETVAFLHGILSDPAARPPLVIDADALWALAPEGAEPGSGAGLIRPCDVLTPHPGEAAFLLGTSAAAVQADRVAAIRRLRELAPGIWLLKGAGTLIAGDGPLTIAPFARATLAVGGSGDVLAGCLATLLAQLSGQEKSPFLAACLAVLVHAEAGSLLARRFPLRGNTASEIAECLPAARADLYQRGGNLCGEKGNFL